MPDAQRLLSVEDAAARLGVSPRRVRALIAHSRVPAQRLGNMWVVEAAAVEELARRPRRRGRPLSAVNAWALLARLSNLKNDNAFVARPLRSQGRIESLLNEAGPAVADALLRSESRARMHSWRVLPGDLDRLVADPRLIKSGLSADADGIDVRYQLGRDGIDAYVSEANLDRLARELRPIEDSSSPNVRLRVPQGADWVLDERVAPLPVIAADLLDHDDARVARAARRVVDRLVR